MVDEDDFIVEENASESDELVLEEANFDNNAIADDDGHAAFNHATVYSLHDKAVTLMKKKGIKVTQEEEQMATQIMPRVSGLAHHVHDSTNLHQEFDKLVSKNQDLKGTKKTLDQQVPTQWNSDFTCLNAHLYF
ncbi:hypothetical protein P691DRAFT_689168 [Macrolepiota fuliginosa MF-IS2]|uniref:Uncharacterized protein n=1 Tax=Macrolepiota fuliginosa MF-IS2 TaxID=1400762 RepID=A0A9P5WY94_9AGAR|nr:hypothetical protein P691DRAFT_689168 [Macrolepiota fuliginosa MF-IS2]